MLLSSRDPGSGVADSRDSRPVEEVFREDVSNAFCSSNPSVELSFKCNWPKRRFSAAPVGHLSSRLVGRPATGFPLFRGVKDCPFILKLLLLDRAKDPKFFSVGEFARARKPKKQTPVNYPHKRALDSINMVFCFRWKPFKTVFFPGLQDLESQLFTASDIPLQKLDFSSNLLRRITDKVC